MASGMVTIDSKSIEGLKGDSYYTKPVLINITAKLIEYIQTKHSSFIAFFRNFTNIKELFIYKTDILTDILDSNNLSNLTKLHISSTDLTSLPESIGNLSKLEALHVSDSKITSLPESIGNLSNLHRLDISNNKLTSLPESFGNLTELSNLFISHNDLTSLPESFVNLPSLDELYLNYNKLVSLPNTFGDISTLSALIISDNNLSSLPESFYNLLELGDLDISNNHISSLSESIGDLSGLQYLNVSNNNLTSLPESIGDLSELIELNASNNNLISLPESIGNLSWLHQLNVSNNKLTSLPDSIKNLSNLDELIISDNNIKAKKYTVQNINENVTNLTNDLFIMHKSTSYTIAPKNTTPRTGESIFNIDMSDIENNITDLDIQIINIYTYRGDYYINKFLSTTIFSKMNNNKNKKNKYDIMNMINEFREIDIFKQLMKRFPPTNKMNDEGDFYNEKAFIQYKQEIIYHLVILTYNSIVHINKLQKEKIGIISPFITYRGSGTHYLKDIQDDKVYYFNSFVSTSVNINVAKEFRGRSGFLYHFIIHPDCYYSYLSKELTNYPKEQEVLLTPYHRYYFIKKKFPSDYVYFVLPPSPTLNIPSTFDNFVLWKNTATDLFNYKKIPLSASSIQSGGKAAMAYNNTLSLPVNTMLLKKNTQKNRYNKKLNTRKNVRLLVKKNKMNTQKNVNKKNEKNTRKNDDRTRRWTEPLTFFPGDKPTKDELVLINKMKAYLEATS